MTEPILSFHSVQKSFDNHIVHRDVSFQLKKNETLGLLGSSGTGKSVLLRSVIGLEHIDGGEIRYRDQRIDHLREKEFFPIRTKISYAFQSGALFDSLSVFENVAYPLFEHTTLKLDQVKEKVREMLHLVALSGSEDLMPAELSGGMQKRVGLARAIILEPDIVLYDEPTAGLDPTNTDNILDVMERLKHRGLSSIFVTHDIPSAVKMCDRLLILHDGVIAADGSPTELMQSTTPIAQHFFQNMNNQRKNLL